MGLGPWQGFSCHEEWGGWARPRNSVALKPGPEMQWSRLQLGIGVATHALGISVLPEAGGKLSQPTGMQQPLTFAPKPSLLKTNNNKQNKTKQTNKQKTEAGAHPPLQLQQHQGDRE